MYTVYMDRGFQKSTTFQSPQVTENKENGTVMAETNICREAEKR
jgi:hypothetical protein